MLDEPIVECEYGWGRTLRLFQDRLEIQEHTYALRDLLHVQPTYRRVLGVTSARLELRFRKHVVVIRGIADIQMTQKIVAYLACWREITLAMAVEELRSADTLPAIASVPKDTPRDNPPLTSSEDSEPQSGANPFLSLFDTPHDQAHVWHDSSSIEKEDVSPLYVQAEVDPAPLPMEGGHKHVVPQKTPVVLDAPPAWPWLDILHEKRVKRLQRLQTEREQRMYGFNVETLAQHLRTGSLATVSVPVRLRPDEQAYYKTEAGLCVDPLCESRRTRYKLHDRGTLIVTNQRLIYLGQKRQIVQAYEYLLQLSQLPGALAVFTGYWEQRQYYAIPRPLECAMFIEHMLMAFHQQPIPREQQEKNDVIFM
ncbi:MAG TPA: hypothetical protein VL461_07580 [Dictyobacter sp.]|jgi:hypothetical protein|nr:hypothetical protein [Dictyobacter sp.]